MTIPPSKPQSKAARNERRKAVAALFNTLSVALMVAALFQPISTGRIPNPALLGAALLGFVVFQWALHYVLGRLED